MFTLESPAFADGGDVPAAHTCDGADAAPPLAWRDAPPGTAAFALVVDDPDAPDPAAPKRVWVHWVLYDLPADCTRLDGPPPAGTRDGLNDWHRTGYGGPCPPIGRHRYFFKLYALSAPLGDLGTPTKADVLRAMAGKVLATAELMGTYQRAKT